METQLQWEWTGMDMCYAEQHVLHYYNTIYLLIDLLTDLLT